MFLAKALAAVGFSVYVVDPMTGDSWEPIKGVHVGGVPGWDRGIKGFRFLTHRIPSLWRTLKRTGAGLFYARGMGVLELVVLAFAKVSRAKFVFAVAADSELMGFMDRYHHFHEGNATFWDVISNVVPIEVAARILVRAADVVLVQHEHQAILAGQKAKKVVHLNNLVDPELLAVRPKQSSGNILLVGAISKRKGLRVLLPIIESVEHVVFEFVGTPQHVEGESVWNRLSGYPNVILHGQLPREQTLEKIATAKALLNVSEMEGFPNTFLEAWVLGTPVISLFVDPGGIIKRNHLGYVCDGDMEELVRLLQVGHYDVDTSHARKYVLDQHSPAKAVRLFTDLHKG
jgi:glycosyltransferase involved in cell wall biosynthesis